MAAGRDESYRARPGSDSLADRRPRELRGYFTTHDRTPLRNPGKLIKAIA